MSDSPELESIFSSFSVILLCRVINSLLYVASYIKHLAKESINICFVPIREFNEMIP